MREGLVIFRRELRAYFLSTIAYVFGLLFLGILIYYAADLLQHGSQARMDGFFLILPFVLLFFVPVLTMRSWAEERKLGTLELLMTFPVKVSHLVLGKFVAALVYLAFLLLLTLGLPLTMHAYGGMDWPPLLGSYFASVLFAGAFVAIGMFWSSVTRDQIVAALLAMASLFVLHRIGDPRTIELANEWAPAWLVDLLNGISPYKYFVSIARGVLDTRDIVYFTCFCGFFLYANALVLHSRRQKG